jgi:GH35 family endo-1,4-beta-xylanase
VTPPEEVLKRLDRFATFRKPLIITEFDIDTNDEQTRAGYTRDFLTAVFSHPAATGFLMWGFWEGSHWKPKSAMYRRDWSEKPNLRAYRDLVFDQ